MKGTPVTNPNKTLIAALLDRSGSMETSKKATEDGWRELINEQRQQPGQCQVTLAQFDTVYEVLFPATDIAEVPEFAVQPRGGPRCSMPPASSSPRSANSSRRYPSGAPGPRDLPDHDRRRGELQPPVGLRPGSGTDQATTGPVELEVHLPRSQHRRHRGRWPHGFGRQGPHSPTTTPTTSPTTAAMGSTKAMITSTRACKAAAFSNEDRQAAMAREEDGGDFDEVGPRPPALACPRQKVGMQGHGPEKSRSAK